MNFAPEFELAVACCRWPPSTERDAAVSAAADAVEWQAFLRLVARHRIEGLVHAALAAASVHPPADVATTLAEAARRIGRESLAQAAEAVRLARLLEAAGIAHLFLKGSTMAILAYGSLGLKRASDIDIAVDPERYDDACTLLERAGYSCTLPRPGASRAEIRRSAQVNKDTAWTSPAGMHVELHKRLLPNPRLLPSLSVTSPREAVHIGQGLSLTTFAPPELFAYLCAHGAVSGWSRLKWPAELNALLSRHEPDEVERLYRRATELGSGRSAAQALLLCNILFGLRLSDQLAHEIGRSRTHRYLLRVALAALAGGEAGEELRRQRFGTARVNLSTVFLQAGLRYKAATLAQLLRRRADRLHTAVLARRSAGR